MKSLIDPETIRRIAEANPIEEIIIADVLLKKSGASLQGLCPFHQERTPSFHVTPARGRFKCFGCGAGGDVFKYLLLSRNMEFPTAVRWLASRGGIAIPGDDPTTSTKKLPPKLVIKRAPLPPEPPRAVRWPEDLAKGTRADLQALATRRGLSLDGVRLASKRLLLGFGTAHGQRAWVILDAEGSNGQARRVDGQTWEHIGDKKAYTLPGSRASWPIGTREAAAYPFVLLVEGGPDLLAAHHFIAAEGRQADTAAVAMLGAANNIPEDALAFLAGKRVRAFPHSDSAGQNAFLRWAGALEKVGCKVDAFVVKGLRRSDGQRVKDLNDLAALDPDCYEKEREELSAIVPR